MVTVPIEIVLQDAETPVDPTPTPTPESGEETNIVVPNTGTMSNDGSNNGGIGSTISIILPIVIAVLALGAMVALLVRRQQKRKNNINANMSKKEKFFTATSGTIAILAATVLVGNLVIPTTNAATDESNGSEESTYLETEDKITITATIDEDSEEDTYIVSTKDILYATTDASGYTVTMSMAQGALTSNLYLDGNTESEYYIASVEEVELTNNTWGYMLDQEAEGYNAVPLADTPVTIKEGEEAVTHEEIDVYYMVKVNKELPLGTYTGTIEYNITPVNPIDKLTYMQDFALFSEEDKTKLLASMPEGEQYILKDKRDEKPYYISKLADGNVWMTQNLDLDLNENTTLTPADTNVSENWTPLRSTINFTGTTVDGWQDDNFAPYSANPGDVYYYTSGTDADDIQYNSLAECEAAGHTDCSHYHAGNYYNWSAVVASNDTSGMTEQYYNAPDSICPAGWRLPEGSNVGDRNYSGVTNLIQSYGILEDNIDEGCGGFCNLYRYLPGGFDAIRTNPLWLVRSGNFDNSGLSGIAYYGRYWLNTVYDENRVYNTYFLNTGVGPSNALGRSFGLSIRCMVQ